MLETAEVRWFAEGPPPERLSCRCGDLEAVDEDHRLDSYLRLAGTEALGVKLREAGDRFEVKLRDAEIGAGRLAEGVTGQLERWRKWSFPLGGAARAPGGLGLPDGSWVEVHKARRVVTWELVAPGVAHRVGEPAGDGCTTELTEVRAGGEVWWTLGFEAFGAPERLVDALAAAVAAFFAEPEDAGALRGTRSCAYPAWLGRLAPDGPRG